MNLSDKILIVEGKMDKHKLEEVLVEPVKIICTFGTMGISKLDEIIEQLDDSQIFILSDADKEGRKIRNWFKKHISEGTHIYIDPKFGEVGRCPQDYLANLLSRHGFYVDTSLIMKGKFNREGNNYHRRYIKEYTG